MFELRDDAKRRRTPRRSLMDGRSVNPNRGLRGLRSLDTNALSNEALRRWDVILKLRLSRC